MTNVNIDKAVEIARDADTEAFHGDQAVSDADYPEVDRDLNPSPDALDMAIRLADTMRTQMFDGFVSADWSVIDKKMVVHVQYWYFQKHFANFEGIDIEVNSSSKYRTHSLEIEGCNVIALEQGELFSTWVPAVECGGGGGGERQ